MRYGRSLARVMATYRRLTPRSLRMEDLTLVPRHENRIGRVGWTEGWLLYAAVEDEFDYRFELS